MISRCCISGDIKPRIKQCNQTSMTIRSATINCDVRYPFEHKLHEIEILATSLDDVFDDVIVLNTEKNGSTINLMGLDAGSSYAVRIIPSINGTTGDPLDFHVFTELNIPVIEELGLFSVPLATNFFWIISENVIRK